VTHSGYLNLASNCPRSLPFSWLRNNLCCRAGLARDVQAPLKCGDEPAHGSNHGRLSGPLDLLRPFDSFASPVIIWNVIAVCINFLTVGAYAFSYARKSSDALPQRVRLKH